MRQTSKLLPWLLGAIVLFGFTEEAMARAASAHAAKPSHATTASSDAAGPAKAYNPPLATAEPAMWRIDNGKTRIYLLGSIHILPEGLKWRTPAIEAAIKSASFFVYETELDHTTISEMQDYTALNGFLPPGQHLEKMLSPQGRKDLTAVLGTLPITEADIDGMEPWLAGMFVQNTAKEKKTVTFGKGVDMQLMDYMTDHKKYDRYLETPRQQMEALAGEKSDEQVANFEAGLHIRRSPQAALMHMVELWRTGDIDGLFALPETNFGDPDYRRGMLDDRNKRWVPQIEDMLKEDGRTFFLTVGAGHMGGSNGVIALLCANGWNVQRIQTGPDAPPKACHWGTEAGAKTAPTTLALKR